MALLFMDSFDHYVTADILEKWTSIYTGGGTLAGGPAIGAFGRRSSSAVRFSATASALASRNPALGLVRAASGPTGGVGFAFATSTFGMDTQTGYDPAATGSSTANAIVAFRSAGVTHVWFHLNNTGTITAYTGTTALGTSTALTLGAFNYLEFRVTIHASTGSITIRKDNLTDILSLPSVDTYVSGVVGWDEIVIGRLSLAGATPTTWDYDDLYLLDGSGSAPWNDRLGECRCDLRSTTGAGNSAQFTPSAGSNYENVDDVTPNDDTDHNTSSTVGHLDTFVVQDAPVSGATIFGVQHCLNMKKMDAGTCAVAPVIRHGTTDYPGANLSPGTAYSYGLQMAATNPGTSAAWVEADFNNAEFGYQKTA